MDYDIKPFLESTADWNKDPNAYLKRYYSLYHKRGQEGEIDVYVRQAPNKICVLGLLEPSRDYKSIKFNTELIGEKIKRDTVLCELLDGEGQTVASVKAHMEGKLLELHTELVDNLDLLFNRSLDHGFIAVIMPKHEDSTIQLAAYDIQT
ncbi:hypothetical protein G6F43_007921 [Rhizopus delemar]|nr:hypothetical protein G6F43_007921 [Rhizopus delemar]